MSRVLMMFVRLHKGLKITVFMASQAGHQHTLRAHYREKKGKRGAEKPKRTRTTHAYPRGSRSGKEEYERDVLEVLATRAKDGDTRQLASLLRRLRISLR